MSRRPGSKPGSASAVLSGGCGCGSSSGGDTQVIACSLDTADFKARTKSVRELAERSLVDSRRRGPTLLLTYSAEASEAADLLFAHFAPAATLVVSSVSVA